MSNIMPIFKVKSIPQECGKNRLLNILTVVGKPYASVLLDHMVKSTETDLQKGAVIFQLGEKLYISDFRSKTNVK